MLIAAAACEMHPAAVLKGAELRSVGEQLSRTTAQAAQAGVTDVPAVRIGEQVFVGERASMTRPRRQRKRRIQDAGRTDAMKANRAYRLIVTRGGRAPALLADAARVDHIEVVEIDAGEVVLFWDRPPQAASRLARALRADLSQLEARGVPRSLGYRGGVDDERAESELTPHP